MLFTPEQKQAYLDVVYETFDDNMVYKNLAPIDLIKITYEITLKIIEQAHLKAQE